MVLWLVDVGQESARTASPAPGCLLMRPSIADLAPKHVDLLVEARPHLLCCRLGLLSLPHRSPFLFCKDLLLLLKQAKLLLQPHESEVEWLPPAPVSWPG